jgi:hypothetical protein
MAMNPATPQDTFDHMIGAGAFQWEWWHGLRVTGEDTPEWTATVTIDNGDDGEVTKTIDHKTVMAAARRFMSNPPKYSGDAARQACRDLVFNRDEADFDADSADQLLQFIVLGEIVFG